MLVVLVDRQVPVVLQGLVMYQDLRVLLVLRGLQVPRDRLDRQAQVERLVQLGLEGHQALLGRVGRQVSVMFQVLQAHQDRVGQQGLVPLDLVVQAVLLVYR